MTKAEIRNIYKTKRKELSVTQKDKLEDLILIQFQHSGIDIPENIMTYAYSDKLDETDPSLIVRYCRFINPGVVFHYPVMSGLHLNVIQTGADTIFESNEYGIDQPVNGQKVSPEILELIFIPLLAFDANGHRVGYGKGYYDRFLNECSRETLKVGLSFFSEPVRIDDVESFDIPLDHIVTPEKCYSFK